MTPAMRRVRFLPIAALAVVLAASGCTQRHETAASSASPPAHPRVVAKAPANPDLATVMERFYQQVEGAHWKFAYAMLSPRYRATLSQDDLMRRYDDIADLDVTLRQTNGRVVHARLVGSTRDRSRSVRFEEDVSLVWDGQDWTIDSIARRDVSPGTH